jgi:hypothetical protein
MEATVFAGWMYDHLKPHAAALKVAKPMMLPAIAAARKKNDGDENEISFPPRRPDNLRQLDGVVPT